MLPRVLLNCEDRPLRTESNEKRFIRTWPVFKDAALRVGDSSKHLITMNKNHALLSTSSELMTSLLYNSLRQKKYMILLIKAAVFVEGEIRIFPRHVLCVFNGSCGNMFYPLGIPKRIPVAGLLGIQHCTRQIRLDCLNTIKLLEPTRPLEHLPFRHECHILFNLGEPWGCLWSL